MSTAAGLGPDLLTAWISSPIAPLVGGVLALLAAAALLSLVLRGARARERDLADRFAALAGEALHRNSEGFLSLASERFRTLQEGAATDLSGPASG